YQSLLHASTRKASGIKLKDQIVIIDEAYNLTDSISAVHSAEISGAQLCGAHSQLPQYCERYSMISQKPFGFVEKYEGSGVNTHSGSKNTENRLIEGLGRFLQMLQNRPTDVSEQQMAVEDKPIMSSPMMLAESFLFALTKANIDGGVVIQRQACLSQSSLKFLSLNAAVHFAQIIQECRAVIIAGGTMQPIADFKEQLLFSAGVTEDRILDFSCGHVIPPVNILPIVLSAGPSGQQLEFTFQTRDTTIFIHISDGGDGPCSLKPGGVVCFFPSYKYEKRILGRIHNINKYFIIIIIQTLKKWNLFQLVAKLQLKIICMKAVSQSIGRRIFSLLTSHRSCTLQKLPEWIRSSTHTHTRFGPSFASIRTFLKIPATTNHNNVYTITGY
uniref:DEAD/H (Asp-Glu-Ala-Asp/His) box helicase 11 n=1 Tax=Cyprinus carpio TaxID=7962 RepID=A0A8C1IHL4_CYPCA